MKKPFLKDQNFMEFMEYLFQKGYAERSPNEEEDNCWYIQHNGLHHLASPGKMKVVPNILGVYLEQMAGNRNWFHSLNKYCDDKIKVRTDDVYGKHWDSVSSSTDSRMSSKHAAIHVVGKQQL